MLPVAILNRFSYQEKQTLGYLEFKVQGSPRFFMLELPWKNNQRKISCIPEGIYRVMPRHSARFGEHFHVATYGEKEVLGRSAILQHAGNYHTQIEGCQLPGSGVSDMNKDGLHDVMSSGGALQQMRKIAPLGYIMVIQSMYKID